MARKRRNSLRTTLTELKERIDAAAVIVDQENVCRLWTEMEYWAAVCRVVDYGLIESDAKPSSPATAPTVIPSLHHHHVQPPSDPVIASVLQPRQNPRPGRLLLENVNNRPQTMDRGTQANTEDARDNVHDGPSAVITEAPSTSSNDTIINDELYRNANISVSEKKLLTKGGDDSSVDSLNSADSAKQDSEDSVIERAEFHQPMITKDDTDGHIMSNGNGKITGAGGKLVNGVDKEHPVDDEANITSCGMECLYFAMQCCECSIM
ncbi:Hypothetical protein CINCED_3A023030 [Cinara cedri]|uniref:Uncharacterized protein n=1 Tax=Cinara cedri TaxID=506608 RepID=A0A5E4NIP0_9HEMI|nr:Hypothetical protein CINCED_3A023030 [Cinara cedri]